MNTTTYDNSVILKVEGIIQRMDTSSRELTLLVNGERTEVLVPPDCLVRLNGERVKLRLLQPGDHAELAYSFIGCKAFAHSIQVNWQSRVEQQKSGRSVALSGKCRPGSKENLP